MRYVFLLPAYAISITLLLIPLIGRADFGPVRRIMSGIAAPQIPHDRIRLESQDIIIHLKKNSYEVDGVFRFFNTGETTCEWLGFPQLYTCGNVLVIDWHLIRFNAWIQGRKLEVSDEADATKITDIPSRSHGRNVVFMYRWKVVHCEFPAHAGTTIRATYEAEYYYNRSWYSKEAFYVWWTGSFWKDRIGKSSFTIDSSEVGGTRNIRVGFTVNSTQIGDTIQMREGFRAFPGPRQLSANVVRYELVNYEPGPEDGLLIGVRSSSSRSEMERPPNQR